MTNTLPQKLEIVEILKAPSLDSMPREREPMSVRQKTLYVPREKELHAAGWHLYWFNDQPVGRIEQAMRAGWTFVTPEEAGIEVLRGDSQCSFVTGETKTGGAMKSFLMKISEAWWEEDQKKLNAIPEKIDEQIRNGTADKVENMYIPKTRGKSRISVTSNLVRT